MHVCLLWAVVLAAAGWAAEAPRPTEARPLLLGNWADPTILKDGSDYYMTHSSFEWQPGLLIWHSKDLRAWRPIARAVVNQEGSIWAPELIKHEGRFYLYYPAAGKNFVVTADSPRGPWSPPVSLGVGHIDPGHVVDESGRRYIHLSGGNAAELSPDGLQATTKPKTVYQGWPIPEDWAIECFCLESPKLVKRGGWYHLTSAQGGTAGPSTSHMVVSARSRGPLGPWENSPYNPIIRTWSRSEPWWSKGHGTLVEGPAGEWYIVLHGFPNGNRTVGRSTLIEPIEWTPDGWFRVPARWPAGWDQPARAEMPMSDEFDGAELGIQWQFHRRWDRARFSLAGGVLTLAGVGDDAGQSQPLAVMPLHQAYEIETEVEAEGAAEAGLMLFSSPAAYIGLSLTSGGQLRRPQQGIRRYRNTAEPQLGVKRVALRIVNQRQDVRFYYRDGEGRWRILQPSMEISAWGPVYAALFAQGHGKGRFSYFRYRGLED